MIFNIHYGKSGLDSLSVVSWSSTQQSRYHEWFYFIFYSNQGTYVKLLKETQAQIQRVAHVDMSLQWSVKS